jgi:hypothetical protein
MARMLALMFATVLTALAADVAGNWKATTEGPNGPMERTFAFKVEGEKLSGETVSSFAGKSEIKNGTIKGDDLAFVITINLQGNEMQVSYKGKVVSKDEIKLSAQVQENVIEWVAKRQ